MSHNHSCLSRRAFLGTAAAVAAAVHRAGLGVRPQRGRPAERTHHPGGIGIGNRGTHDLNWMLPEPDVQFVATCDPQKARREAVKKLVDTRYGNNDCAIYADIREFLATRTDIDAVLSTRATAGTRWRPSWRCGRARTCTRRSPRP